MVYIAKQSMRRNFAEVSRDCFVDPKTASKAFNTYVGEKIKGLKRETPRVLGIDEKWLKDEFRAVLGEGARAGRSGDHTREIQYAHTGQRALTLGQRLRRAVGDFDDFHQR